MSNGIHTINTLCPICSKISMMGHVNMTGHEIKYICPLCEGRHYGMPEQTEDEIEYICGKCNEKSSVSTWESIPMDANEPVLGPIESCSECNEKLADGKTVAFIVCEDGKANEEGRNGEVIFAKPHAEFLESLKNAGHPPVVYIEKSVVDKMLPERK